MALENVNNRRIITTEDGKQYQKAGAGRAIGGFLAGDLAANAINRGAKKIGQRPALAAINGITSAENFSTQVLDVFEKSGLKGKGVRFLDVANSGNAAAVEDALGKSLPKFVQKLSDKNPIFKRAIDFLKNMLRTTFKEGKNACYSPGAKAVVVNNEKLSISAFHEMGHALNANASKFGKILQKCRPLALISSAAFFIGILKRKKAEGEKPKNFVDKVTTFVKDHCGAIAFAGFAPTLVEEGMASFKGYKLAQKVLDPNNLKKVAVFQGKAWLSYVAAAVGFGLATHIGVKIKDAIAKPKEIKKEAA